nr:CPBP family intramembrane glutamic endopeptidase [Spelaeicoccus albus]
MRSSGRSKKSFGYRRPVNLRAAWWLVPPVITIGLVLATAAPSATGSIIGAYLVLSVAVAVNEETWFRGNALAVLRPVGIRAAIVVSSVLFGVMHLANLAGGADLSSSLLQMVFALIFGVVAAELVVVTSSLWPAILWHAAWDFVNYLGGNETVPLALVGVELSCAVMIAYAMRLWRWTIKMNA